MAFDYQAKFGQIYYEVSDSLLYIFIVETQWEKPDALQQANTTEQTAASSEEQTAYQQASTGASSAGDTTTAGVKRSSNDDTDGGSEVKKPYDGRGYCRGGAYGSWTVVAVR